MYKMTYGLYGVMCRRGLMQDRRTTTHVPYSSIIGVEVHCIKIFTAVTDSNAMNFNLNWSIKMLHEELYEPV